MHTDIGGHRLVITRLPQRRARGRLFAFSGREIALAAAVAAGAVIGLGVITERAHSASAVAAAPPGFAWVTGG
jgi:hypothetical protein